MSHIDPYDDGIGIVLALSREATDDDLALADELLTEWLEPYQEPRTFRNCGCEGERGERSITLWADRIADPSGSEAALARAAKIGERARELLPVASTRITTAEAPSSADLEARLGTPVFTVRPGGDLVGDVRRAGLLPGPAGLRPFSAWLLPVLCLRLLAAVFDDPVGVVLSDGSAIVGVTTLAIASRRWCGLREHLLAAATVLLSAAHLVVSLRAPISAAELVLRVSILGVGFAWVMYWLRRGG